MMIVVVILGILAGLASVGYRRYIARARLSEATVMLAEIVSRENVYFMEFAHYLPLRKDNPPPVATGATGDGEPAAQFHPKDPTSSPVLDSPRTPHAVAPLPQSWNNAGVRPKATQLFCTYYAHAGLSNSTPGGGGTFAAKLWGNVAGA